MNKSRADWSTSDLALVAWLRYNGVEPSDCQWSGSVGYFYFDHGRRSEILALETVLNTSAVEVDLRKFNQIFGATKQEMFAAQRVSA